MLISAAALVHSGTKPRFAIKAHIISASSPVRSASTCFRMAATVAEPAAGTASSPQYGLSAGFQAHAVLQVHDDIFFNAFEDCPP